MTIFIGLIFGTGHNHGLICLWDINSQDVAIKLNSDDSNDILKISFSENGYYFVSTSKNSNVVNLWDLRKQKIIREINLPENSHVENAEFDYFGNSIGICADRSYIYNVKTCELVSEIDSIQNCNFLKFDRDMEYFMTTNFNGDIRTNLIFN